MAQRTLRKFSLGVTASRTTPDRLLLGRLLVLMPRD